MQPNVYTIPASVPFLTELAHFVVSKAMERDGTLDALPSYRILLPSRRAVRALQFEFIKLIQDQYNQSALLMPRLMPIGDIDDEELDLSLLSLTDGLSDALNLPDVISNIDRRWILAELIAAKDPTRSWAQCLDFAKSLAQLMDQVHTENLNLADLSSLVEIEQLSEHWRETLEFLNILSDAWPQILNENKVIESADRRNRLLKILTEYWSKNPPNSPVIAAGSTGSIPAVAELLNSIAHMKNGAVILPGLDVDLSDDVWSALPLSHPQANLKNLINRIGIHKNDVLVLNGKNVRADKENFLHHILLPPEFFLNKTAPNAVGDILKDVHVVEAEQEREEAQYVALILRRMIAEGGKNGIVISPDRNMARRISAELKRWGIEVNDSAGQGLHTHKISVFLKTLLEIGAGNHKLSAIISLLRSPYIAPRFASDQLFAFEKKEYRSAKFRQETMNLDRLKNLADKYKFIDEIIAPLSTLLSLKNLTHSLRDFLEIYDQVIKALIVPELDIWGSDAGRSMAQYLQELAQSQTGARPMSAMQCLDIVSHFWSEKMVRDSAEPHPNITILGQIEARLLKADVMILAGLNEGTWPADPLHDPWMSRPMRHQFGLPPVERTYALSAHDFCQSFCAHETYLVRSLRVGGTPTIPSRWLQRMEAYLNAHGIKWDELKQNAKATLSPLLKYLSYANDVKRIEPPMPMPPLAFRPKSFYVTDVETLIKNPYRIYVQKILKLRPLDEVSEDDYAARMGTILHAVFDIYVQKTKGNLLDNAETILMDCGAEIALRMDDGDAAFWDLFWHKFKSMVPSFVALDREWRKHYTPLATEQSFSTEFMCNDTRIELHAKPDRIDDFMGCGYGIIDYKTGKIPSGVELIDGRKPQMPLEMLMASRGAFGQPVNNPSDEIVGAFWYMPDKTNGEFAVKTINDYKINDIEDFICKTESGFLNLIADFLNPATPLAPASLSGRLYATDQSMKHFARSDEWGIAQDGSDDADVSGVAA